VHDDVVGVLGRIWGEGFGARIRLAAATVAALVQAVPHLSGAERHDLVGDVARLQADGRKVLSQFPEAVHWGPEGRAWAARLEAEVMRARWLTGIDAPSLDDLLSAWHEAEERFVDHGHVHELARVRLVLAEVLRVSGDLAGSRAYADLVRESAARLGAGPLLEAVRRLAGTPAREPAPLGATGRLTARETEILALVAEGRSNGEVAKQLFISTKTVSVHVSNILGKLGAAGRTEAAAIARRRGLLD
jgi:DNA-binding CsgD family transcriptional regulator